jgi:acyl carrier protein
MVEASRKENILKDFISILEEMTGDWDMDYGDPLSERTRLVEDLEFESIDVVQLIVAIEQKFGVKGIPFEKVLMQDGRYVDEIRVEQFIDFLDTHLPAPAT